MLLILIQQVHYSNLEQFARGGNRMYILYYFLKDTFLFRLLVVMTFLACCLNKDNCKNGLVGFCSQLLYHLF